MVYPELPVRKDPPPSSNAAQTVEKMEDGGWKATTANQGNQDCVGCDFTLLQHESPDNQRHMAMLHRIGIG